MPFGNRDHGSTNVLQVTFVLDDQGDCKAVSGYERDVTGKTFGQFRQSANGNLGGRQLITEVLKYLSDRLTEIEGGD